MNKSKNLVRDMCIGPLRSHIQHLCFVKIPEQWVKCKIKYGILSLEIRNVWHCCCDKMLKFQDGGQWWKKYQVMSSSFSDESMRHIFSSLKLMSGNFVSRLKFKIVANTPRKYMATLKVLKKNFDGSHIGCPF